MKYSKEQIVWIFLRLSMGFIFFWAFLDKLFGLGRATAPDKSWLAGGSPTAGFLQNAVTGPFADFYHKLAGNPVVDWLFMLGLLFMGLALILGIGMKIAGYAGALLMLLMWASLLFPKNNPILDEHVIQFFVLLGFTTVKAGRWFGLGKWWAESGLVKKYPFLE